MRTLQVTTPDGVVDCTEHTPATKGPWPAVLFFVDAGGVRPAMHAMAERLAANGFYAFVPNIFHRAGAFAPFDPNTMFTDPAERARVGKIIATVEPGPTMRDVGFYLDAMAPNATRIGAQGYCMGGTLAFRAAAAHPTRIASVAGIHAGHLVTDKPDSPHLGAPSITARVYLGCADNDRSCTPEHRAILEDALTKAGVVHEIELYSGKAHGFAVSDFPVYDEAASEHHWQRVLRWHRDAFGTSAARS